jgi:hypothetical protein
MDILVEFNAELFKKTGKYYHELNTQNKIKVLNEAEILLEKFAAKQRAIIRQLRKKL